MNRFLQELPTPPSPFPSSDPADSPHPTGPSISPNEFILYAMVMTAVVLMALCLMVRARMMRARAAAAGSLPPSRQQAAQQAAFPGNPAWPGQPSLPPGLNPMLIASFPQFKYNQEELGRMSETSCVVCLEEYRAGENLLLLPECNHAFHLSCIEGWFTQHTSCPVCRASLLPKDDQVPDSAPNSTPPPQELRPLVRGNPSRFIFSRPPIVEPPDQSPRL